MRPARWPGSPPVRRGVVVARSWRGATWEVLAMTTAVYSYWAGARTASGAAEDFAWGRSYRTEYRWFERGVHHTEQHSAD